ncbi:MAG: hypothetical protein ACXV9P_13095, partial [Acidimicrobiia bacterium]
MHVTPSMELEVAPGVVGPWTIVQLVPSQCSIRVAVAPSSPESPTAKQSDGCKHDTSDNRLRITSGTFGLGTI